MSTRKRLSDYSYTPSAKKFKPVVKATFPVTASRSSAMVVPGYTRVGGAYRRSLPGGSETKYNDCTITVTPTTTWAIPTQVCVSPLASTPDNPVGSQSLVTITQGQTDHRRIGNKMTVYQFRMRGNVTLNSSSVDIGRTQIRCLLVMDMQANGASAVPSDVMEPQSAATSSYLSFANMDNVGRFKILKDKVFTIDVAGIQFGTAMIKMNHKIKEGMDVHFSGSTGAITEIRSNNLFLMFGSSSSSLTVNAITRVYWKDK